MKTTLCQCGTVIEVFEGTTRQCRVCGATHGSVPKRPPRPLPHLVETWSPCVTLRRDGRSLVVVATQDIPQGQIFEKSPTIWFDRPSEVAKMVQLNITIGGPNPKGVYLAPAVYQCKMIDGNYEPNALSQTWEGAVIPLGYGALYETGVGSTVNADGRLVFERHHLFVEWYARKDIKAGHQIRQGMGVYPRE